MQPTLDHLVKFGGTLLRPADAPPHGGFRGYVADPDGHAWEIAYNPAWPISPSARAAPLQWRVSEWHPACSSG